MNKCRTPTRRRAADSWERSPGPCQASSGGSAVIRCAVRTADPAPQAAAGGLIWEPFRTSRRRVSGQQWSHTDRMMMAEPAPHRHSERTTALFLSSWWRDSRHRRLRWRNASARSSSRSTASKTDQQGRFRASPRLAEPGQHGISRVLISSGLASGPGEVLRATRRSELVVVLQVVVLQPKDWEPRPQWGEYHTSRHWTSRPCENKVTVSFCAVGAVFPLGSTSTTLSTMGLLPRARR